jgi:hypothetical protein
MKLLKKYVKLQFLQLWKFVCIILVANLFIQAEFIVLIKLSNYKILAADKLYYLTIASYAVAFMSLFLITLIVTVNSGCLLFFRASRKTLHETNVIFLLVLSIIFSILHIVLAFIYRLIFKGIYSLSGNNINYIYNYKAVDVIDQFIIVTLIFFVAALVLYFLSMLTQSFGFKVFIIAVVFLVIVSLLMFYKFPVLFGLFKLIKGSSILILCLALLALAALFIYLDWIATKKLSIKY